MKTLRVLVVAMVIAPWAFASAQGVDIPPPRGFVNDFAGVIDNARADTILRIVQFVREQSGGEIAVVTLRDIGGRDANDVALRIGREWGVGRDAAVGDSTRNAGVVILVVPKETAGDNRGRVAIQVGQGAEGFIPDGVAGAIWREALPLLQRADYGGAMALMTYRVAERYAAEFGFSLDSARVAAPPARGRVTHGPPTRAPQGETSIGPVAVVFVFGLILFVAVVVAGASRRAGHGHRGRGALDWLLIAEAARRSGRRSSGWGGGGFGGFGGGGGGFGGGFGGFGGGGGFSGGGSGGSW